MPLPSSPPLPALKSAQRAEFLRRAQQLGHDLDALEHGLEERRFFTAASVEGLRLLRPAALVPHHVPFFYQPVPGAGPRSAALVFAGGPWGLAPMPQGPVHVQAISIDTKVLGPGEQWDVSPHRNGEAWALADLALYVTVNVRRLILHPGAAVVARGQVFSLLCQEYVCLAGAAPGAHQVAIGAATPGAATGPQESCALAEFVFRGVQGPLAVCTRPAAGAAKQRVVLAGPVSNST